VNRIRVVGAAVLTASMLTTLTGCQSAGGPRVAAEPVGGYDDTRNVSRTGDVTFAGQPTETALERYAGEGGSAVINIRTLAGGDAPSFDEQTAVEDLGMTYSHVPMSSSTFSTMDVKLFIQAMRDVEGPVMVHCGSSNRVGGMWAAYLALEEGVETETAIELGKAAGMRSESVEEAARRVIAEGRGE
jgi:uncharacterized protein (TIGR01244 family)